LGGDSGPEKLVALRELSDGLNDCVCFDDKPCIFYLTRLSPATGIIFAKGHLLTFDSLHPIVSVESDWLCQAIYDDPFLLSCLDVFPNSRHVAFLSAVDKPDFRTEPSGNSGTIDCAVTSADNHHIMSQVGLLARLKLSEKLRTHVHSQQILARNVHSSFAMGADGQKDCLMTLCKQLIQAVNPGVETDVDAHFVYLIDLVLKDLHWQPVFWDTDSKHATGDRQGVIDGHSKPFDGQIVCSAKPCWA
jgi:hypothetical protein